MPQPLSRSLLFLVLLFCFFQLSAQNTKIQFERVIGGPPTNVIDSLGLAPGVREKGNWVGVSTDGGYFVAGQAESFATAANSLDWFVFKTDAKGQTLWTKALGTDGAFGSTTTGWVSAQNELFVGGFMGGEAVLCKFSANGDLLYQRTYGEGEVAAICPQANGGLLLAINSPTESLVLPIDNQGLPQGQARLFSPVGEMMKITDMRTETNGGFLLTGFIRQNSWFQNQSDAIVMRLNTNLSLAWGKRYGGAFNDVANAIVPLPDGGSLLVGETYSFGYFIPQNRDIFLTRLAADGETIWSKAYGGLWEEPGQGPINYYHESANDAVWVKEDGFVWVAGLKDYFEGYIDSYFMKVDPETGNVSQDLRAGGMSADFAVSIAQTADSGFVFTGQTNFFNRDVYLVKTDPLFSLEPCLGTPAIEQNSDYNINLITSALNLTVSSATLVPSNGNLAERGTELATNSLLNIDSEIQIKQTTCPGANDGEVSIQALGGLPPYLYYLGAASSGNLFPRVKDSLFTGLPPGDYVVLAADKRMCTSKHYFTIIDIPKLEITANDIPPYCPGEVPSQLEIHVRGGRSPLKIVFNNTTIVDTVAFFNLLAPGEYTITLLDSMGCDTAKTVTVVEGPLIEVAGTDTIQLPRSVAEQTTHELKGATPIGGFWQGPSVLDSLAGVFDVKNLKAGEYEYTYTLNGCTGVKKIVLIDPPLNSILETNVLTPNGDGFNDELRFSLPAHTDYLLQIFAPSGVRIFSANRQEDVFKGYFKGSLVQSGVYFFRLKFTPINGNPYEYIGNFTLIR